MNSKTEHYVGAIFSDAEKAKLVIEDMVKNDFPMDQLSILHKAGGQGDDFLGIAYTSEKERFKIWGTKGALLGSVGGLLAGAAGLFILPGLGPVLVAGPLIDALAGAAVGAGLMSAGAAISHMSIAMKRLGIPDDKLQVLHQAIMEGKTVLLMHCGNDDPEIWHQRLLWDDADAVFTMP